MHEVEEWLMGGNLNIKGDREERAMYRGHDAFPAFEKLSVCCQCQEVAWLGMA